MTSSLLGPELLLCLIENCVIQVSDAVAQQALGARIIVIVKINIDVVMLTSLIVQCCCLSQP